MKANSLQSSSSLQTRRGPENRDFVNGLLILLCHKLALGHQGHLDSRRAIVRANLMRMLVMDDLTWRSVRIGGSAEWKTVG